MRVAITHTRYTDFGGVERTIASLVGRLLDGGHEVHYFCHFVDGEPPDGLNVHIIPNPLKPIRVLKVLSFDRWTERAIEAEGPFDLVHGWSKTSRQDLYTDGSGCLRDYQEYSIGRRGNPVVRSLMRLSPHQRAVESIERKRFTQPGVKVITMSRLVRDQILRRYGLPEDDVEVLYNGIEHGRFHADDKDRHRAEVRAELGLDPGAQVVLFLANDYDRKGLDTLLTAFARLATEGALPDAARIVVGGRERPRRETRFRELAAKLGVGERVSWIGPRRDPERLFAAADVFAVPTRFDAFGNVVLEAMASATPPIVSTAAGAVEVIDDGKTGVVLDDPDDAEELAGHIRTVLDPERGRAMGVAAADAAKAYTWDRYFDRTLAIYDEVAERKRAAAARG